MSILLKYQISDLSPAEVQRFTNKLTGSKLKEDKPYDLYVSNALRPYTTKQQGYLWAIYTEIANQTGHEPQWIHEVMKQLFKARDVVYNGKIYTIGQTTTNDTTKERTEYIEKVRAHALQEWGIETDDPGKIPDDVYVDMLSRGHFRH